MKSLIQVNEIAWNMTGDKFFLTTGNGEKKLSGNIYHSVYFLKKFDFIYFVSIYITIALLSFWFLGTVEVLAYPSLDRVDTLMAHTAGCYCIAIDPLGRFCIFCWLSASALIHNFQCGKKKSLRMPCN